MSLEGKTAFVSGASRPLGNGKAIAIALAKMGADVAVSGWNHMEGARFNVTANSVLIGISTTDAYMKLPEAVRNKVEKKTVFGKAADPNDIANAVAFLASEEARYMTGAVMNLMGGLDLFVF